MIMRTETRVEILGRIYQIREKGRKDDDLLNTENIDGYCDREDATIVIVKSDNEYARNSTLRHELIHAFLFESGLGFDWRQATNHGHDETTIDWFAHQWPKIHKIFAELGCEK